MSQEDAVGNVSKTNRLNSEGAKSVSGLQLYKEPSSANSQSSSNFIIPMAMERSATAPAKKGNKLRTFTRRATKLAADVAFGSATMDDQGDDPKLAEYRRNSKNKAEEARKELEIKHFESVLKAVRDHSMEFYLDYLRFFLKYMDDGDWDDALNYAGMRNDLWRGWIKRMFTKFDSLIDKWENDTNYIEIPRQAVEFSIASVPDVSVIDKEIFHDRKITLLLLWHAQILKRVMNQPLILKQLTATMKEDCEICIVTTNKLKSKYAGPDEYLPRVLRAHISPAHLEFIDGWQMRHDVKKFKINFVTLCDRYQALLDLRNAGTLPDDLQQQYPHFNDYSFLSKEFTENYMNEEEKKFLYGYSSFAAPNISKIPLKGGNHGLVYSPDFSRLVKSEIEMEKAFKEFHRLLKPGGKIYIQILDLNPISKSNTRVGFSNKEAIEVCKEEYTRLLINSELAKFAGPFKARMSLNVLTYLQRSEEWKDVRFTKIGCPVIEGGDYGSGYDDKTNENKDMGDSDDLITINSRAAALFDMNVSFTEFIKFTSVLGALEWYEGGAKPSQEILDLTKLWIDWRRFGIKGEHVNKLLQSRTLVDGVDTELGVKIDFNLTPSASARTVCGVDYSTAVVAQRV